METAAPGPTARGFGSFREAVRVPVSAAIMAAGGGAIALLIIGGIVVTTVFGWTPYESIVAAIESRAMTTVVWLSIAAGAIAAIAGFSLYRRMPTKRSREQSVSGAVLGLQAALFGTIFLLFRSGDPERFAFHFLNFERLEGYGAGFLNGAKNTLILAFAGEIGGIILGLLFAMLVLSHRRAVRAPARAYINFFRGTPLVWQLSFGYSMFLFGFGLQLSAYVAAIIIFILNTGAYAAEVFRAGIQSIERGQMEAARGLGMSYVQAMRYAVVPQAFRRVIPPLMNEFVILIKDTSLVFALGLLASQLELYSLAREGYADTFNATFFVGAAIGYLAITLPLIRVVNWVEKRLRSGLVGVTG